MRISTLIIALSGALLLTNCANGKFLPLPDGYYTSSKGPVLKPAGLEKAPAQKAGTGAGLVWNKIDRYDAAHPSLPVKKPPVAVLYEDVSVFPVDGDTEPYEDMKYDFTRKAESPQDAAYDRLPSKIAQQVFFGYGSAGIGPADRQKLKVLAKDIAQTSRAYKVRVVGHASKRIDHALEPGKQQMVNFTMAQKRADAVALELQKAGVKPYWILTSSRGDSVPNPDTGAMPQEAADRRVDVYVEAGTQTFP